MKTAVIGSRGIDNIDIGKLLPDGVTEIVTGGARGVDACAARYAEDHNIKLTVFTPEYEKYGRAAPIVRNRQIVDYADEVVAVWDGKSKGTLSVIKYCEKASKRVTVHKI